MSGLVRGRAYLANLLTGLLSNGIGVLDFDQASGSALLLFTLLLDHRSKDYARLAQHPHVVCRARRGRQRFLAAIRPLPAAGTHVRTVLCRSARAPFSIACFLATGPRSASTSGHGTSSQLMEKRHG
jgi:hypothetical protein